MSSKLRSLLVLVGVLEAAAAQSATVAYWRFEEGPADAFVPHAGADGAFDGSVPDVSSNGNGLSAWTEGGYAGFAYRADVPGGEVPATSAENRFSIQNTGSYPAMFTSAAGSAPSGINAETITPAQFTIEASYKPEASGGYRTIVGRDARDVATSSGDLAALYFQVRPDDSVGMAYADVSGYVHRAYSPPGWIYGFNFGTNPGGNGAPWYNLAAVCDGATLSIYVDNIQVASTDLTLSGSPNRALTAGSADGASWQAGAWSVGRGLYAGGHTDRAFGLIDEVRISNVALDPAEFLFAPRPFIQQLQPAGGTVEFTIFGTQAGATGTLLYSADPTVPLSEWGQRSLRTTLTGDTYSFTTSVGNGAPQYFYALKTDIPPPGPIPMTYEIVGSWPADARDRIVYALEGAAAQYSRYAGITKHVWANYSPGTPTADANFEGWINFGSNPSYQNYRTALHEISHTLGVGTTWQWGANLSGGVWTGAHGVAQIRALDGPGGVINSDGTHFWPYGLNYDSEGNTENFRRHVLMVAAFRKDMGLE